MKFDIMIVMLNFVPRWKPEKLLFGLYCGSLTIKFVSQEVLLVFERERI